MALPLTIRRAPDKCGWDAEIPLSPRIDDSSLGRARGLGGTHPGQSLGMRRSGLATFGTVNSTLPTATASRKENLSVTTEEICKLLERKTATEAGRPPNASPTRLEDSLSLARFYEALSLQHPPPELRNIEVRALHGTTQPIPPWRPSGIDRLVSQSADRLASSPIHSPLRQQLKSSPSELERDVPASLLQELFSPRSRRMPTEHSPLKVRRNCCSRQGESPVHEQPPKRDHDIVTNASAKDNTSVRHTLVDIPSPKRPTITTLEPVGALSASQQNASNGTANKRDAWFHGPVRLGDLTLEEQTRIVEERFAKQQRLYTRQLRRAKRFGRAIDMDAIFGGDDRIDEVDVKDFGIGDAQARLRE